MAKFGKIIFWGFPTVLFIFPGSRDTVGLVFFYLERRALVFSDQNHEFWCRCSKSTTVVREMATRHLCPDLSGARVQGVKKGRRSSPENYRPVSLTSICCKINEHIIVSQTMNHLEKNNILVDYQHGFRRRRSCESQLLITSHDLATILNKRSQVDVAVLDFAKAFDKVPHQRLIKKLQYYNLDKKVVGWIQSFLSKRTQSVVVDGHTSTSAPVLSGVPQGTVLGPLLFLLFINDIANNVTSSIRLFADDCLVYRETRKKEECELLQKDLDELVSWSKTWGMAFNVKKCNIVSITNAKKNRQRHSYHMDDQPIKSIDNTPYLGVNINKDAGIPIPYHKKMPTEAEREILQDHSPSET